jgi:hypothetical protein
VPHIWQTFFVSNKSKKKIKVKEAIFSFSPYPFVVSLNVWARGSPLGLFVVAVYYFLRFSFSELCLVHVANLSSCLVFFFFLFCSKVVIAIFICLLAVLLQLHFKPFVHDTTDWYQFYALLTLFLMAALLQRVNVTEDEGYNKSVFGGILVMVNAMVLFIAVLLVIYHTLQTIKKIWKLRKKLTKVLPLPLDPPKQEMKQQ